MAHDAITATPCAWCQEAETLLASACGHVSIDNIRRQVEQGAVLFRVEQGAELIGFYVLRIDDLAEGAEGVIVAGAGRHPNIDLTATIIPLAEQQFQNVRSVRIHTDRPGLVRKLVNRLGYAPMEFVFRKKIA